METRQQLNDVIGTFVEWAITIMDAIHNGEPYTGNGYDQDPYVELMLRPEAITTDPNTGETIVRLNSEPDVILEVVAGVNCCWCYIRAYGCQRRATYEPNHGGAIWQALQHWIGQRPCDTN